jgi:hypothetical protein
MLDSVKDMEYKYKMMDPGQMIKGPKYSKLGPFGLLVTIQHAYSRLLCFQDCPALASTLPETKCIICSYQAFGIDQAFGL